MAIDDLRVILIGGPPGAGKTTLGRGLAARLGAVPLTLDDVIVGVRAATDPETHPAFHPMRLAGGHVRFFTERTPEELIAAALDLEHAGWPIVEAIVASHVRDGPPLVLDWWLLRPREVATLTETAAASVASVWVHIDPDVLAARESAQTDFYGASPDPGRMLANFMERSWWRNELAATEATELGLPVLRLDGTEPRDAVVDLALAALA